MDRLGRSRLLFILRGVAPDDVVRVAEAVAEAGFTHFEVTSDSPGMPAVLRRIARAAPGLSVGAGTVLDLATAEAAIGAGAAFLVSPHTDEALVAAIAARGVPAIPGAVTPTEILRAHRAGAAAVKLFPARGVGPDALRDLRGPLPEIRLIPTGGIAIEEIPRWLEAGAFAVGVGRGILLGRGERERLDRGRVSEVLARLREITVPFAGR